MEPTFDQVQGLLVHAQDIATTLVVLEGHIEYLAKIGLAGFGLMIGSQIWRNFILAKNQRYFW